MKNSQIFLTSKNNLNIVQNIFYFPTVWNVIFLESFSTLKKVTMKRLYLFTNTYYFYLPVPYYTNLMYYDKNVKAFLFTFKFKTNYHGVFWNLINKVFAAFSVLFFKKLKFKGKGYYIFKNRRNTIALQFGYSHKIYVYSYFLTIKFISKTVVLMFGINDKDLTHVSNNLFNTRPHNIFTNKGVRFAKQIIYKKTGKISSYR